MDKQWVRNSGMAEEVSLQDPIRESGIGIGTPFVAFYSDRFECGYLPETLCIADAEHLLELRCFTEQTELWIHRSSLSIPFAWRFADDQNIQGEESTIGGAPCRIETYQLLNIDWPRSNGIKDGIANLIATGGGNYQLPMTEMNNAVRVVNYVSYDENGMALIADYRIAGFANVQKGDGYLCPES